MDISRELIEKAKTAASAAELLEMAEAYGIELSARDAETYYKYLNNSGALSDEEMEQVAGGKGSKPKPKYRAGQRVRYYPPSPEQPMEGTITESWYVDLQKAFYYWVQFDNGRKEKFPLESRYCPAKVL